MIYAFIPMYLFYLYREVKPGWYGRKCLFIHVFILNICMAAQLE